MWNSVHSSRTVNNVRICPVKQPLKSLMSVYASWGILGLINHKGILYFSSWADAVPQAAELNPDLTGRLFHWWDCCCHVQAKQEQSCVAICVGWDTAGCWCPGACVGLGKWRLELWPPRGKHTRAVVFPWTCSPRQDESPWESKIYHKFKATDLPDCNKQSVIVNTFVGCQRLNFQWQPWVQHNVRLLP